MPDFIHNSSNSDCEPKSWYVFCQGSIVLEEKGGKAGSIPVSGCCPVADPVGIVPFRWLDGEACMAVNISSTEKLSPALSVIPLRNSFNLIPMTDYRRAGKAVELLEWDRQTQYCGHCGAPLEFKSSISKYCPNCHVETWPKLSPAIIVLISRGDEILLVQSLSFKHDYYGLVAGFVELGETLEECVRREVREETGLRITNLRYFGSQAWPYPRNLMAGFMADYEGGVLLLQREELRKGGWFRYDNLPPVPEKLSIARMLIDAWVESKTKGK